MTERFIVDDDGIVTDMLDLSMYIDEEDCCEKLNELHEEKERWKSMTLSSSNENSILWNEIHILMEQGAELSDAFKKYLDNISTDYDKFWRRKLKQAKRDKVIE